MKRITGFVVFLSIVFSIVACGTGSPSAPLDSASDSSSDVPLVTVEPTPTEDPRELLTSEIIESKLQHFVYMEDDFDHSRLYASKYDHQYDSKGNVVSTELDRFFDPLEVYLSVNGTECSLLVRFAYYGDDWIFFDTADFSIKDEIYTVDLSSVSPDRKVLDTGTVREIYYVEPGTDLLDIFSLFDSYTSTKIRLRGDGSYVFPLSSKKKQGILETVKVYYDLIDNYRTE